MKPNKVTRLRRRLRQLKVRVDPQDLPRLSTLCWAVHQSGYVFCPVTSEYQHRLVLNAGPGQIVDHKNGNRRDNRRINLRCVSPTENGRHRTRLSRLNQSGTIGVCRSTRGGWRAYITASGRQLHLGTYRTKEEAIRVRRRAERLHFGRFAPKIRKEATRGNG